MSVQQSLGSSKFDNEVVPVAVPQRKGDPIIVSKDEEFTNVKIENPNLKRCFFKRRNRNCSSSTINDGAAADDT
jgi:acetyl-CoA C-acetyltransferase